MERIIITKNESNQRLDRFLKKYLRNAPLSYIYKTVRRNTKVNGKRADINVILNDGDEVLLYLTVDDLSDMTRRRKTHSAKKQFKIAYEDENLLIAEKPLGLLIHGDRTEKKNTLANQVIGYLRENNEHSTGARETFAPSPVNRLDRNTTGLVIFGKNLNALQQLNEMIRQRGQILKYYLTIVKGSMAEELVLRDLMSKDRDTNTVSLIPETTMQTAETAAATANRRPEIDATKDSDNAIDNDFKPMVSIARPVSKASGYTFVEIELITGRTHQIRAQLAAAGFPVIGDPKYGNPAVNARVAKRFGLTTQFLHAYKLVFQAAHGDLAYIKGLVVTAPLSGSFEYISSTIFGADTLEKI